MGGLVVLAACRWKGPDFLLMVTIPLSLLCLLLGKPLNLLALGDHYARNLGLNIRRARFLIIFYFRDSHGFSDGLLRSYCFYWVSGASSGKDGLTHLKPLYTYFKFLHHWRGATALLCNLIARLPGLESELPINSVTAFIGAPVVISVIIKRRKENQIER